MAGTEGPIESPLTAEQIFDSVGPAYETAFEGLPEQVASITWLSTQLAAAGIARARILDIGCGTGKPVASTLTTAGHDVLGIDISGAMITAARDRVPTASFEQVDVRHYLERTAPASFDAVTVYFSLITDVSQHNIKAFIKRIFDILRPGGLFVFATVPIPAENIHIRWMGRLAVVSGLSSEDTVACIRQSGFAVLHEAVSKFTPKGAEAGICAPDDVWEETHLFVYAMKPGSLLV